MVLDPIPQSLPLHFFGSRPQPPTSPLSSTSVHTYHRRDFEQGNKGTTKRIVNRAQREESSYVQTVGTCTVKHCNTLQHTATALYRAQGYL